MSGIYAIYHTKFPHKQYIGSTSQEFKERFRQHLKEIKRGVHRNHLQNICNKYGADGMRMSVLFPFKAPKADLRRIEQKFIDHHMSIYGRENLLNGTVSSTSMLDDPDVVAKTKAINSIRMSQNNKDEEYLAKVRTGITNVRENNVEYLERRKEWAKTGLNSTKNREKCKAAIIRSCAKKVMCLETMIVYDSINDAVRYLKTIGFQKADKAAITRCSSGKVNTAYGFKWLFV
jgi:group I intron endonuclease